MGNLSAKFGNLDVLFLRLTPATKETRSKRVIKCKENLNHVCMGWAGSGRKHLYKIGLIAAV